MLLLLIIILNWHRPDKDHASLPILRQFAQTCFRRIVGQNLCQFARIVRKISCQMVGKISCHIAVQQMVQCSKWCSAANGAVQQMVQCSKNRQCCRLATVLQIGHSVTKMSFTFCSRFVPCAIVVLFPFCSRFVPVLFLPRFHAILLRKIVAQDCCENEVFHATLLRVQPVSRNIVAHYETACQYTRRKTM